MELDQNENIKTLFGIGSKDLSLKGSTGYNNGVYLLNDICKSRYENSSLGATARNLNVEDIESKMNSNGIETRNTNRPYDAVQYGTTREYTEYEAKYPAIYAQEKYSGVNVRDVAYGTQVITGNVNLAAQAKMNPYGKTQSENVYITPITDTYRTSKKLTCTQTFYILPWMSQNEYFDCKNFENMIFETETYFWIASRNVNCPNPVMYACFGLFVAGRMQLGRDNLFTTYGDNIYVGRRLAPVVSFNSKIKIKSGTGTEDNPYIIVK